MNETLLKRYAIAGPQNFKCAREEAQQKMQAIIMNDITMFQYRDKGTEWRDEAERIEYVTHLRQIAYTKQTPFIVNDDINLALAVQADGVHLGQDDVHVDAIKDVIPADMLLGMSINTVAEMKAISDNRIDYLGIGPIFPTKSKKDASEVIGVKQLSLFSAMNPLHLPMVGIGGITLQNMASLRTTDLSGVAVISLLTDTNDLSVTIQAMKDAWK